MGQITADQSQAVMGILGTNTRWSELDFDKLNLQARVVCDPTGAGANFMNFLRNGLRIQVVSTNGIIAPPNGIVWPLTVPVNESRGWNEAIKAAGPNTDRSSTIWKVGDQYPPTVGAVEQLEQIWLVNFGKGSRTPSRSAISWGKEQHLVSASPRANFAIAEHFQKLNSYLNMDSMAIVSLRECSFEGGSQCSDVWFYGAGRGADLGWFGDDWNGSGWLAFVREFDPGILGS